MPAKIDVNKVDNQVVAVMKYHEEDGLSLEDAGKKVGISKATAYRITQRPAYHNLATDILEDQHGGLTKYIAKVDALTEFSKKVSVGIDKETGIEQFDEVPDGNIQTKNVHKILDIFGVEPPKEHDVRHTLASLSNEELIAEVEKTERKLGVAGEREQSGNALSPSPQV